MMNQSLSLWNIPVMTAVSGNPYCIAGVQSAGVILCKNTASNNHLYGPEFCDTDRYRKLNAISFALPAKTDLTIEALIVSGKLNDGYYRHVKREPHARPSAKIRSSSPHFF